MWVRFLNRAESSLENEYVIYCTVHRLQRTQLPERYRIDYCGLAGR